MMLNPQTGPRNAQRLLAESPVREQRRQELIAQKKSLNEGLQVLDNLRDEYQDAPSVHHAAKDNNFGNSAFSPPFATPPAEEMEDVAMNGLPSR
jgi:hypothetical protein